MNTTRDQSGFTVIEILVTLLLFSMVSAGFYTVLFASRDGSRTVRDIATISQEARLGFNRMIRDTREAVVVVAASPTSYTVRVDFDGDRQYTSSFEQPTFAYDADQQRITISDGTVSGTETLIAGVRPIGSTPIFSYGSNLLEYDTNADGVTSMGELDAARASGVSLLNNNLLYITNVTFAFEVVSGDSEAVFYTQAQLRNFRGAV